MVNIYNITVRVLLIFVCLFLVAPIVTLLVAPIITHGFIQITATSMEVFLP